MNWNPFKSITLLESRIQTLEGKVLELHIQLSDNERGKEALELLRKMRQREAGRRYYQKKKAMKAKA